MNSGSLFYAAPSHEVSGESGCFLASPCKKGDLLEIVPLERALPHLLHIDDFMNLSDHSLSRFCYRFSGDIVHFCRDERRIDTDYINHSRNPNVIIYMGLTYAVRDIHAGEELLADYGFLMHERFSMDCGEYAVCGYPAHEAERGFLRITSEFRTNE